MKKITFQFDFITLKGFSWEIKTPKANVVIFTGMEEHVSRYDYFAQQLNKAGYSVFGLDVIGQGENVLPDLSNRGVWPVDGFNVNVDAYGGFIKDIRSKSDLPLYVFAHSMGSFMLQSFIQKYPKLLDKAILCGSGSKNNAVGLAYIISKSFTHTKTRNDKSNVISKLMFGNFNSKIDNPVTAYDWLSYNTENVSNYIADPLCGYGPNRGFCLDFLKGMKELYTKKGLNNINKKLPIYIIAGKEDPVAGYGKFSNALLKMYKKIGVESVDVKLYEHARHEILNEDIKDEVIKDVISFFEK